MGAQKTRGAPSLHLICADTQPLPHFTECQHSSFTQSFPTCFYAVVFGDAGDHRTMEWFTVTGCKAARVQVVSNRLAGVVIE